MKDVNAVSGKLQASSAEKKDTVNLSSGLGLGPMFGAKIKLEREPKQKNTENVAVTYSKPSP